MHSRLNRRSFMALLAGTTVMAGSRVFAQTSYYIQPGVTVAQADATRTVTKSLISGSGSTFAKPLYAKWADVFFRGSAGLQYEGIGSGGGIIQFAAGVTDFAGSDVAMSDEQTASVRGNTKDVIHVPAAYGGIAVTYNLPGYRGTLNLTGEQIAQIYLGQIRKWNDARLVKTNPALASVDQEIIVFHRQDASGTTAGFTAYLDDGSAEYRATVGSGFAVYWLVGAALPSNKDIVTAIKENPYSIGYADYNFVVGEKMSNGDAMPMASLKNGTGNFVAPNPQSIASAVQAAASSGGDDLRLKLINTSGASAYPLVTATYIIFHQHQPNRVKADILKRFLLWAMKDGQAMEAALNYVPLPPVVAEKASRLINSIDDGNRSK